MDSSLSHGGMLIVQSGVELVQVVTWLLQPRHVQKTVSQYSSIFQGSYILPSSCSTMFQAPWRGGERCPMQAWALNSHSHDFEEPCVSALTTAKRKLLWQAETEAETTTYGYVNICI